MRAGVGGTGRGQLLGPGCKVCLGNLQKPEPISPGPSLSSPSPPQTETKVEPYEVHDPVPLIVGSSVGGLVLLGLITAAMYKVPLGALCLPLPPPRCFLSGLTAAVQPLGDLWPAPGPQLLQL